MSNLYGVFERRGLLTRLGVVTITGLAGCASFSGPQTETGQSARITILLTNSDNTDRDYEVEVNWGGNNRSLFTGTLQPGETDSEMIATTGTAPDSAEFLIGAANSTQSGSWSPTDCPDYHVDVMIENGNPSFSTTCGALLPSC